MTKEISPKKASELDYRNKANYWIEKNRLNIILKDAEHRIHIKSIDAFLKDEYKESYRLAKLAHKINQSHDVLHMGAF